MSEEIRDPEDNANKETQPLLQGDLAQRDSLATSQTPTTGPPEDNADGLIRHPLPDDSSVNHRPLAHSETPTARNMSEGTLDPADTLDDEIAPVPPHGDLANGNSQGSGQTEDTAKPPSSGIPAKATATDQGGPPGGAPDSTSQPGNTNTRPSRSCLCFTCGRRDTSDVESRDSRSRRCRVCCGGGTSGGSQPPTSRRRSSGALIQCLNSPWEAYQWLSYYIPVLEWGAKYKPSYIIRDIIAGLTLASISIPMSLSYAANLARIRPINGLYACIPAPCVYAILGPTRRLAVLPEAALSLMVGEAIRRNLHHLSDDPSGKTASQMASLITFLAGLITLLAGLFRLGYVDIIGSPPLLRGFITGVALVILTEQFITELGLETLAKLTGASHASTVQKLIFVCEHIRETHLLTLAISLSAFVILVTAKYTKEWAQTRYRKNWISLIPEIFTVVVFYTVLTWYFRLDKRGITILGKVESGSFGWDWPIHWDNFTSPTVNIQQVLSSSFVIAILGYFESMVGVKYLAVKENDVHKPNRELVALGAGNVVASIFPGLPVYGGLGRSKVNEYSNAKSPLSGVVLAGFTLLAAQYALDFIAWLPKASLAAVISVVSLGLLQPVAVEFRYYWRLHAWMELTMMIIVVLFTLFWSIDVGIYIGITFSLFLLMKASANYSLKPVKLHTQVVDGNTHYSLVTGDIARVNANDKIDFYPFVLIVKIATDNLTFVNTARIKDGIHRLEHYGFFEAHPSAIPLRHPEQNVNVVFVFEGVTGIDPSATWTLQEILKQYIELGTEVYLVDLCDAVRESFTRSKIWKMLEAHTNDSHVFPTLHGCLQQIHKNGGNIDEAKDRAAKAGRSVDEAVAEFAKVGEWFNT